jgi:hypothetical protein
MGSGSRFQGQFLRFSQVVDLCMDHLHLAPNVRFLFSDKDALTNGNLAQTWPPGPRSPRSPRPSRGPQHDHQGASLPFSIMFACVTFTHVSTCIDIQTQTHTHTYIILPIHIYIYIYIHLSLSIICIVTVHAHVHKHKHEYTRAYITRGIRRQDCRFTELSSTPT